MLYICWEVAVNHTKLNQTLCRWLSQVVKKWHRQLKPRENLSLQQLKRWRLFLQVKRIPDCSPWTPDIQIIPYPMGQTGRDTMMSVTAAAIGSRTQQLGAGAIMARRFLEVRTAGSNVLIGESWQAIFNIKTITTNNRYTFVPHNYSSFWIVCTLHFLMFKITLFIKVKIPFLC